MNGVCNSPPLEGCLKGGVVFQRNKFFILKMNVSVLWRHVAPLFAVSPMKNRGMSLPPGLDTRVGSPIANRIKCTGLILAHNLLITNCLVNNL